MFLSEQMEQYKAPTQWLVSKLISEMLHLGKIIARDKHYNSFYSIINDKEKKIF
jgi:hypothetical protein